MVSGVYAAALIVGLGTLALIWLLALVFFSVVIAAALIFLGDCRGVWAAAGVAIGGAARADQSRDRARHSQTDGRASA